VTDRMTNEDAADQLGFAVVDRRELRALFRRKNVRVDAGEPKALDGRREVLVKFLGEEY
jgi:hypothetical protein